MSDVFLIIVTPWFCDYSILVAAANCVNIPLMRQQEIKKGITIQTEDGQDAGLSGNAAVAAISQVVPSRVGMNNQ